MSICRFENLLAILLLIAQFTSVSLAQDFPKITWGDPSAWRQIEFRGNESFTRDELRGALAENARYLLARHSRETEFNLQNLTEDLLTRGYQNEGFIHASVSQDSEALPKVVFDIKEGKRFRWRAIEVRTPPGIEEQSIRDRLTKPHSSPGSFPTFSVVDGEERVRWIDEQGLPDKLVEPLWTDGAVVPFGDREAYSKEIVDAINKTLFREVAVKINIKLDESKAAAKLIVEITDVGEPERISSLSIVGIQKHTETQVSEYLDLDVGQEISQQRINSLTQKLWRSGRFSKHQVVYDHKQNVLKISLDELATAPMLGEALSSEAKIYLKARDWLSGLESRGEDIELYLPKGTAGLEARAVFASKGTSFECRADNAAGQETTTSFLMDEDEFILNHSEHPGVLCCGYPETKRGLVIGPGIAADSEDGKILRFFLRAKSVSERSPGVPPVHQFLDLSPVWWISFAYHPELEHEIKDGVLSTRAREIEIDINEDSGEIKRMFLSVDVRFVKDAFRQHRKAITSMIEGKTNHFESHRPLSSLLQYVLLPEVADPMLAAKELVDGNEKTLAPALVSGFRKLANGGAFSIADDLVLKFASGWDKPFSIPQNSVDKGFYLGSLERVGAMWALQLAGKVFEDTRSPKEAWPVELARCICLLKCGKPSEAARTLRTLATDPENGPLCHATVAHVFSFLGNQGVTSTFAAHALDKMNPKAFQRDIEVLAPVFESAALKKLLVATRSLTEEEFEAIDGLMKESLMKRLFSGIYWNSRASFAEVLYNEKQKPLRASLEQLLR